MTIFSASMKLAKELRTLTSYLILTYKNTSNFPKSDLNF